MQDDFADKSWKYTQYSTFDQQMSGLAELCSEQQFQYGTHAVQDYRLMRCSQRVQALKKHVQSRRAHVLLSTCAEKLTPELQPFHLVEHVPAIEQRAWEQGCNAPSIAKAMEFLRWDDFFCYGLCKHCRAVTR